MERKWGFIAIQCSVDPISPQGCLKEGSEISWAQDRAEGRQMGSPGERALDWDSTCSAVAFPPPKPELDLQFPGPSLALVRCSSNSGFRSLSIRILFLRKLSI